MKLLVLGASGGVGRHVVSQGVQRGHTLRALYREQAIAEGVPAGVEIVRGDPMADGVIEGALDGVDAVISCLGMRRKNPKNPWSPITAPEDFNSAVARTLVSVLTLSRPSPSGCTSALGREGLRVAAISSAGVAESYPRMNLFMRMLVSTSSIGVAYRDLAVMEQVYRDSGLDWCCVRPVTLTDGPKTGAVRVVDHFGATMSISRADVAGWLLDWIAHGGEGASRTPQIAS